LLSGELTEARDVGAELYALGRVDPSRLYVVLDAMAYLACADGRFEVAARVLDCADRARADRGQARPRPVEAHMRALVRQRLAGECRSAAADRGILDGVPLEEAPACALALGLN